MSSEPRRLHPAAAVVEAVVALRGAALPILAASAVGGSGGGLGRAALFALLGTVAALAAGVAAWRSTTYSVVDGVLRYRSGLFSPDETVVPVARVQSVDTVQGVLQRAFGAVELHVQTPGGKADGEVVLRAVSPADARALRDALGQPEPAEPEARLVLGTGALLLAAITAPQFGVVLPVVGAIGTFADDLFADRFDEGLLDRADSVPELAMILTALTAAAFAISFAAAIIAFAGFEVEREGDRLRIRRGLLQRRAATVPVARIDGVTIVEGLLRAPFGLATLRLETASRGSEAAAARTLFPLVRVRDIPELLTALVPGLDGAPAELTRPPRRAARRAALPPAFAGAVIGGLTTIALPGAWPLVPALVALGALQGLGSHRATGLAVEQTRVVLRARPGLQRATLMARRGRLQETSVARTPLERPAALASFGLALGSGRRVRARRLEATAADAAQAALR